MEDCREPGGLCNERSPQDIQDGTAVLRQSPTRGGTGTKPKGTGKMKLAPKGAPALTAYQKMLSDAVNALGGMRFGRCVIDGNHDTRYWKPVEGDNPLWGGKGRALELQPNTISPAEAIEAIFRERAKWAFDCAEFVQMAHLWAHVKFLGPGGFNSNVQGKSFRIRPQGSTGLDQRLLHERASASAPVLELSHGSVLRRSPIQDMDRLVRDAPIGSRIGWFRHVPPFPQNVLKLGPDKFAAHNNWNGGKVFIFTRNELEKTLRDGAAGRPVGPDNLVILMIEQYVTP